MKKSSIPIEFAIFPFLSSFIPPIVPVDRKKPKLDRSKREGREKGLTRFAASFCRKTCFRGKGKKKGAERI